MGVFVDYGRGLFRIKNTPPTTISPTTILIADAHPIIVRTLNVSNKMDRPIRFNLQQVTIENESYDLIPELEVPPYQNVDVISKFGLNILLKYMTTPDPIVSDSLVCYTGYHQECVCTITYIILNDLPLP